MKQKANQKMPPYNKIYKIKEKTNKLNKGFAVLAVLFFIVSLNIFYATVKKSFHGVFGAINYAKEIPEPLAEINSEPKKIQHIKTPESVKAIYMSSWVAGTKERREELINFTHNTEINAIIIDVKDFSGNVFIKTDNKLIKEYGSEEIRIPDIKNFIDELHNKNIYTIARISVFQDDYLAKKQPHLSIKNKQGGVWEDRKGISWLDPANKQIWDYAVEIGKETERVGFDELNFDYIRFPSDGNLENAKYTFWDEKTPKNQIIKNFFVYLSKELENTPIPISANLFGLTLWRNDDMNIGQIFEDALPYFDYIAPMVYPSHYPAGFNGFKNPAAHPYEIIFDGMQRGKERIFAATSTPSKLRPWLQDFDLGADYDAIMIQKEKQAVYDAGLNSFMMWNASNRYTKGAYEKN